MKQQEIITNIQACGPCVRTALAIFCGLTFPLHAAVTTGNLRCEYLADPLGIDVVQPRLSWVVESALRGEKQTAYQILVASAPDLLAAGKADMWDSGKVAGDATSQVAYSGAALNSRSQCFWKVRSWDKDGKPSEWSKPAFWTVGLLQPSDWSAKWIDASERMKPVRKPKNGTKLSNPAISPMASPKLSPITDSADE